MSLAGTPTLLRLARRRDRWMMLWWVLGAIVLYWSQAVSVKAMYPTQAEFDRAAAAMEHNAAFIAMAGPARALDTIGGQVAWQASAFGAIVAGLLSMLLVGRHTRAEEESGRDELVRASVVGRHATLACAAIVVLVANLVLGAAVAASLVGYGLAVAGSVSLGTAAALAGLVFGAVALLAAQLTASTRTVYGITGSVIGAAYALRAVGDVGNGVLSWLSPIGWGQAMRAFAGERWWPVLPSIAAVALLVPLAVAVFDHRDFAAGVWPDRPGAARAPGSLSTALGLAWRLQRATIAGWAAAMLVMGAFFGSMGRNVSTLIGDSQWSREVWVQGRSDVTDAFYGASIVMLGLVAAGFTVSSALRLRSEEEALHAELVLATGVSRWRWAGSGLVVSAVGSAAVITACGLGLGLAFAGTTGDAGAVVRLTAAAVQQLAPMLVLLAVTLLAYALRPRWAPVGWLVLTFCVVVLLFGHLWRIPRWAIDLSPFTHPALVPADAVAWAPLVALLAVAVALTAAGLAVLARRDVA